MKKIPKDWGELFVQNLNRNVLLEELEDKNMVTKALEFAIKAHEGQIRKGDGKPYIIHPINVAIIIARANFPDLVIAAGLLHDTVEDTKISVRNIEDNFGSTVAEIVDDLTEKDKSLPWKVRKEQAIAHIQEMDTWSLSVKTADKIDNLRSMYIAYLEQGPNVMKKFNAPMTDQIEMDKKLYNALRRKWPENPLLSQLKEVMDDVMKVEKRYKLLSLS